MFEGSLVESRNLLRTNNRWTTAVSLILQISVAAILVALPLLHPEALSFHALPVSLVAPQPAPPQPPPVVRVQSASAAAESYVPPMATVPRIIPIGIQLGPEPENPEPIGPMAMGNPNGVLLANLGPAPRIVVRPAAAPVKSSPAQISSGVAAGMLLAPLQPLYPRIAIAAGVQGTVVIEAVISKTGTVESLRVVSGPAMLQRAALDAVQNARYSPFRLNGIPTEIETTFSVNFKLND